MAPFQRKSVTRLSRLLCPRCKCKLMCTHPLQANQLYGAIRFQRLSNAYMLSPRIEIGINNNGFTPFSITFFFRCVNTSITYPGEIVGWVRDTLRFPLCCRRWTVTERSQTSECDRFSENYENTPLERFQRPYCEGVDWAQTFSTWSLPGLRIL